MSNLFRKVAVLTDLHLGLKSNSTLHNEDCLNFVKWFTATAKANGCETVIMTGDWHNNRASINVVTLNQSLACLEILNSNFDRVFFIPGNHDLYYREKRDTNSIVWAKHLPNVQVIDDFYTEGDVTLCPWLVEDDHKKIRKIKTKYMFGHFELPHFLMNAHVMMPDHSEIKREDFDHVDHVFSGHFHKRQTYKNITYIGNCFPHNYADAGDDDRGMMILEWGMEPTYLSWPDQPRYRVFQLSNVLDAPEKILMPGMHVRVHLDIDISYEEANFIKETFIDSYKLREITLLPMKREESGVVDASGNISFETVDQIVTSSINKIESKGYDPKMLLEIYRNL